MGTARILCGLAALLACACSCGTRGGKIPSATPTPGGTPSRTATPAPTLAPRVAFVTNGGAGSVSVLRESAGAWSVVATVAVGGAPQGIAVSWDGSFGYVCDPASGSVRVFDALAFAASTAIPVGGSPREVAVNTPGTRVFVTDGALGALVALSSATGQVVATATVGPGPYGLAVAPGNDEVYVAVDSFVAVFDGGTLAPQATVTVGGQGRGVALRVGTSLLFASDFAGSRVSVLDTSSGSVLTVVGAAQGLGTGPSLLSFSPIGARCYVACEGSDSVTVLTGTGGVWAPSIPVGDAPHGIAATRDGAYVLVANAGSADVSIIDTSTDTVTATLAVGASPRAVAVAP